MRRLLPLLLVSACASAAQGVGPAACRTAIRELALRLRTDYVFPDLGEQVAATVSAKAEQGGYDSAAAASPAAFADALARDLRRFARDRHFDVRFDPGFKPRPGQGPAPLQEVESVKKEMARLHFGLERVDRLPGDVAYLDLRGFAPAEFVIPAYTGAMALVAGSEALILDLRRNGGGDPQSVALFLSFFFGEQEVRHLNDVYTRVRNVRRQYWTVPVQGPRFTGPVFVLTSASTFSGGEECAYDFQTQKRAILLGEKTGGGANPGAMFVLGGGFTAFIPTGRAINPVTRTNWDQVGVRPDLPMPAAQAFQAAYAAALKGLIQKEPDPDRRRSLEGILAKVERGAGAKDPYVP